MWVRYRACDRSGTHSDWSYQQLSDHEDLKEFALELRSEYESEHSWDEGYRGHEVEQIETPPLEWIEAELVRTEQMITRLAKWKWELRELGDKLRGQS